MLTFLFGYERSSSSSVKLINQFIILAFVVGGIQSAHFSPANQLVEPQEFNPDEQLAKQDLLNSELAKLLSKYVLIQTGDGYILGRTQRSVDGARVRRFPAAERNFQLRVRKAMPSAESNFQLRVRKAPKLERNFQLRVRKSMPAAMDKNFQLRVRKPSRAAESNFQLRVRKSQPERDFQLRVRKAPRLERNFQLRVRKSDPRLSAYEPTALQELLERYQLLRTPSGSYLLQNQESKRAEEMETDLEEENAF